MRVELTPVESAQATLAYRENKLLLFCMEMSKQEIAVAEADASALTVQLEHLKNRIAQASLNLSSLEKMAAVAETAFYTVSESAIQRLGEEAHQGEYGPELSDDGTVIALTTTPVEN